MSGFLDRLARRTLGTEPVASARVPGLFAAPEQPADEAQADPAPHTASGEARAVSKGVTSGADGSRPRATQPLRGPDDGGGPARDPAGIAAPAQRPGTGWTRDAGDAVHAPSGPVSDAGDGRLATAPRHAPPPSPGHAESDGAPAPPPAAVPQPLVVMPEVTASAVSASSLPLTGDPAAPDFAVAGDLSPSSADGEATVHIHIGRVEVRTRAPAPAPARATPAPPRPGVSLDEYLRRGSRSR